MIDGHDTRALRSAMRHALAAQRPVVVHVRDGEGQGLQAPAEEGGLEGMEKWHAAKPKSIANRVPAKPKVVPAGKDANPAPAQYTKVFGERPGGRVSPRPSG